MYQKTTSNIFFNRVSFKSNHYSSMKFLSTIKRHIANVELLAQEIFFKRGGKQKIIKYFNLLFK